jgi:hypothetical protein
VSPGALEPPYWFRCPVSRSITVLQEPAGTLRTIPDQRYVRKTRTIKCTVTDPIPVPDIDLGAAGAADLTGGATTALNWSALKPDDFERLLFDLIRDLDGYQNVEWLMKTNAPDRGRDISLQRVVPDAAGTIRTDRVIVQAKHYTSKSVGPSDVQGALTSLPLWEPPVIRSLIIATSSRFSSDAVTLAEKHNDLGNRPLIELWPDSRLETLLARRPKLAITYGLRV